MWFFTEEKKKVKPETRIATCGAPRFIRAANNFSLLLSIILPIIFSINRLVYKRRKTGNFLEPKMKTSNFLLHKTNRTKSPTYSIRLTIMLKHLPFLLEK